MALVTPSEPTTHFNNSAINISSTINMSVILFTQRTNTYSSVHPSDFSSTSEATNITSENIKDRDSSTTTAAIAVFVGVMGLAILGSLLYIIMRRKRNLSYLPFPCEKICMPGRKRHDSSTSFNNPLTAADGNDLVVPRERELFSIGDQDGGSDGRIRSRARVEAEDDYFYDEIFERSAFVDETTNKSNKQLTVEDFDDEFDIPDLTFKPPTFKTF